MEEKTIEGSDRKYIYRQYKTLCEAAGVSSNCFYQRIHYCGWEPYEAATTPLYGKRKIVKESPSSKPNDNVAEKQMEGTFTPKNPYLSREYVRWRRHALDSYTHMELGQSLNDSFFAGRTINSGLNELKAEIDTIEENAFWYDVIDRYVADPKAAEQQLSGKIIEKVRQTLADAELNKESLNYKIYYRFATQFGIKLSKSLAT